MKATCSELAAATFKRLCICGLYTVYDDVWGTNLLILKLSSLRADIFTPKRVWLSSPHFYAFNRSYNNLQIGRHRYDLFLYLRLFLRLGICDNVNSIISFYPTIFVNGIIYAV